MSGLLGPGGGPLMLSRRLWLIVQAMRSGASWPMAVEAVATTAIEHPEWDMTETKTWFEWEQTERSGT